MQAARAARRRLNVSVVSKAKAQLIALNSGCLPRSRHFLPYQLPRVRSLISIFNGFFKLGQSGFKRGLVRCVRCHNKVARFNRNAALFVNMHAGRWTHRILGAVAPNPQLYARASGFQGVYAGNETIPRGADFGAVF
jgi:hypothetical protein